MSVCRIARQDMALFAVILGLVCTVIASPLSLRQLSVGDAAAETPFDGGKYEMRWFFEGRIPDDVNDWFSSWTKDKARVCQEQRVDLYLVSDDADFLGTKLREGKLEIKYLSDSRSFELCDERVNGSLDIWKKWKWNYAPKLAASVEEAFADKELKGGRVSVEKDRVQVKFQLVSGGNVEQVDCGSWLESGIVLELTQLRVEENYYWTVGFDLLLKSAMSADEIRQAICTLFERYGRPDLTDERSSAYPAWLTSFVVD